MMTSNAQSQSHARASADEQSTTGARGMKEHAAADLSEPTPLAQRTQQLRALWQSLPAYVSAFNARPAAT